MDPDAAWRVILVASLSNIGFQAGAALLLGSAALFTRLAPVLLAALATGVALLFFWPGSTGG